MELLPCAPTLTRDVWGQLAVKTTTFPEDLTRTMHQPTEPHQPGQEFPGLTENLCGDTFMRLNRMKTESHHTALEGPLFSYQLAAPFTCCG